MTVDLGDALAMWTIYDRPADFPDKVVVRKHTIEAGKVVPAPSCWVFDSVEEARKILRVSGLTCLGREPGDTPSTVETWI